MIVKPLEKATERYVRKSARAFLEGEKSLNWITGVLGHSGLGKEATMTILGPLRNYGEGARAQALFDWLSSNEW